MEPRIDSVVMGPNGHHAQVSGPINWDSDETSATFGAAITQVTASGHIELAAGQNPHVFTPATARWTVQVDVLAGGQFAVGQADGWAVASVLENSGSYEAYPWVVNDLQITTAADVVHAPGSH